MKKISTEAWIIFLLLTAIYGYFYQDPSWNGNSRFALTFAIVRDGRLSIDPYPFDMAFGLATGDISQYNGHYYTDKAIGSSLIAAIFYLPIFWLRMWAQIRLSVPVVKQLLTFFALSLPSAASGALIYYFCATLARSSIRALIVTLSVCLGTMIFTYSVVFFGHQLAGSVLFTAFFVIYQLKKTNGSGKSSMYLAVGFLLGLAVLIEYPTAYIGLCLGVYYLFILFQKRVFSAGRSLGLPVLGGLLPLLLMFGYNWICFGSPIEIGYQNLVSATFQEGMANGLMGIGRPSLHILFFETFHPTMGLFWQSPVLLMIFVGAIAAFVTRRARAEVILSAAVASGMLLMNAGYYMWWGGHALGTRAIIPMLPFLAIPLILVPRKAYYALVPLAVVSIFQMLVAAASDIMVPADRYAVQLKFSGLFDYVEIYNHCWWKLTNGVFGLNLGRQWLGLETWASLIPLAVLFGLGLFVFLRVFSSAPQNV